MLSAREQERASERDRRTREGERGDQPLVVVVVVRQEEKHTRTHSHSRPCSERDDEAMKVARCRGSEEKRRTRCLLFPPQATKQPSLSAFLLSYKPPHPHSLHSPLAFKRTSPASQPAIQSQPSQRERHEELLCEITEVAAAYPRVAGLAGLGADSSSSLSSSFVLLCLCCPSPLSLCCSALVQLPQSTRMLRATLVVLVVCFCALEITALVYVDSIRLDSIRSSRLTRAVSHNDTGTPCASARSTARVPMPRYAAACRQPIALLLVLPSHTHTLSIDACLGHSAQVRSRWPRHHDLHHRLRGCTSSPLLSLVHTFDSDHSLAHSLGRTGPVLRPHHPRYSFAKVPRRLRYWLVEPLGMRALPPPPPPSSAVLSTN